MPQITYNSNLTPEENMLSWVNTINLALREVYTGRVWENKVTADRQVTEVYNSLPITVQAEMIEEEAQAAQKELEGILI